MAILPHWQQFCGNDAEKPDKFELAGAEDVSVRVIPGIKGRLTFDTCFQEDLGAPLRAGNCRRERVLAGS